MMLSNTEELGGGGANTGKPLFMVSDLTIWFGGLKALDSVSLDINKGEIVGMIGPNGAGKTVLLNCISGIYKPNRGLIFFEGQNITGLPPHKIASLGIARTFQQAEVFKSLTALENTLLGQHIKLGTNVFTGYLLGTWAEGRSAGSPQS